MSDLNYYPTSRSQELRRIVICQYPFFHQGSSSQASNHIMVYLATQKDTNIREISLLGKEGKRAHRVAQNQISSAGARRESLYSLQTILAPFPMMSAY